MMKKIYALFIVLTVLCGTVWAENLIPPNNPNIQFYGRWNTANTSSYAHSWPGVYVYAEFEGTSIGVRTNDNFSYYNVFVDDTIFSIFHGNVAGVNSYSLVSGLPDGHHKILFTLRSETNWTEFSFNGFVLDDGKNLDLPAARPVRRIEFIGDSYTVASGNEWTGAGSAPNDSWTNNYKGFGPDIARHYGAEYQTNARGGIGLVLDYLGSYGQNLPDQYDRTLLYSTTSPKWNFSSWDPNVVVICLGLNDYNGWNGYSATVPDDDAVVYRARYHDFISRIMDNYPGVRILAVAANGIDWLKNNISQVVAEENSWGHKNVFYTSFPYYTGEYVNSGHPSVAMDQEIADTLISVLDTISNLWTPYQDITPPRITELLQSPFTVYDTSYILNVQTDSYTTLRYSTADIPYAQMENTFTTTTGTRDHSVTLSCLPGMAYQYYIRGIDAYGNAMDTSAVIHFMVDTTKHTLRWTSLLFDDSRWKSGPARFGSINDDSTATQIETVTTAYFRRKITLDSIQNKTSMKLYVNGREGAIIYINGQIVGRIKMTVSPDVPYDTFALDTGAFNQKIPITGSLNQWLINGVNIIAAEIHSGNGKKAGVAFDLYLADASGNIYSPAGSEWSYYDLGTMPGDQAVAKPTDVAQGTESMLPKKMILHANYPNPFNPTTTIRYELPAKEDVSMKIFDLLGREIVTLVNEMKSAGSYNVQFNASTLSSGMYFCRLQAGHAVAVSKLMLVK
jgi:Carbohydrate esterase 2 N-terminal/Secretion system C-terminal sorting domain/GDSL-like Lipase/Acylhydrolase family